MKNFNTCAENQILDLRLSNDVVNVFVFNN